MRTKSKEDVVQEYRIRSIQEAALRVIARKGMSSATMADIADEAGVAKGTLYLYFRDRDELVERTFEDAINRLQSRLAEATVAEMPFEEKIRAIVSAKFAFFREHSEFFRLFLSLRMPEGTPQQQRRHKRACAPQYEARVKAMAGVLEKAMDAGELRRTDPFRAALFLIEGSTAIVLERLNEPTSPPESEDVDFVVNFIVHGLGAQTSARSEH
jgi:AcrR family transcriptional regulator